MKKNTPTRVRMTLSQFLAKLARRDGWFLEAVEAVDGTETNCIRRGSDDTASRQCPLAAVNGPHEPMTSSDDHARRLGMDARLAGRIMRIADGDIQNLSSADLALRKKILVACGLRQSI